MLFEQHWQPNEARKGRRVTSNYVFSPFKVLKNGSGCEKYREGLDQGEIRMEGLDQGEIRTEGLDQNEISTEGFNQGAVR